MENQQTTPTVKKSSRKHLIWIVFVVIIFLIGAVLGYGFYAGAKVGSYAKSAKAIMKDSNEQWTMQKLENEDSSDPETLRSDAELIKKDSEEQLAKLEKLNAPFGVRALSIKINDYFTTAQDMSANILEFLDYLIVLEGTQTSLTSFDNSISDVDSFIKAFEEFHNSLAKSITELEKADPPASYEEFNTEYLTALKKFDALIVQALKYAKNDKFDQIDSLTPQFNKVSKEFSQISSPDSTKAIEKIITDEEKTKLREYPEKIKNAADDLLKVKFSF